MNYFPESLYKKVLPSLLCLLIANLFVVEAIKGQCTFRPLLTDSIKVEVSPSADNRVLTFSDLALILGQECPPGPTTHLWMTYPVMGGTSLPVYLGTNSGGSDITITCAQDFDVVQVLGGNSGMNNNFNVPTGSNVTFYSAPQAAGGSYTPIGDNAA
ncbi:MAG: hypothetical protein AB8G86_26660, partial [Saprospiraceae bacterium]